VKITGIRENDKGKVVEMNKKKKWEEEKAV
jgi:hypothetical protein